MSTTYDFLNTLLGRFLVTREEADVAFFKTPTLRNVLVTAPYFHDGSMETLWDAVDHYNKGDGLKDPWLDDDIEPLALTENEIDDLVAFMASLTSPEYKEIGIKELARQRALARISRQISPLGPGTATHLDKLTWLRDRCYCGPNNLANLLSRLKQLDEVPRGVEQPNLRTTRPGYYIITTKLHAGRADFGMKILSKKTPTRAQKLMRKSKIQLFSYCG